MPPRAPAPLDPAQLRALRRRIAIGLAVVAAAVLATAIAGVWPATLADALGARWFGRSSLRLRVAVGLVVVGGIVLAALLVALAIRRLVTARRRR